MDVFDGLRRLPSRWSSAVALVVVFTMAAGCSSGDTSTAGSSVATSASSSTGATPTATGATALEADHIFGASVPGYAFVELPKSLEQQARKQFQQSSGLSKEDAKVDLRSITKDGTGVGVVLVVTLSPEMAALAGVNARSFAVGIAQSANSDPKKVSLGPTDGYVIEGGGQVFVAWQEENLLIALIGQQQSKAVAAASAVAQATAS